MPAAKEAYVERREIRLGSAISSSATSDSSDVAGRNVTFSAVTFEDGALRAPGGVFGADNDQPLPAFFAYEDGML